MADWQVEPQAKAKKTKRKCTPAQLAGLARAREKRNAKMAEKRQIKKDLQKEDPKFQEKPSNRTTSRPVNNGTN